MVLLARRKGFCRHALQAGADLVPVYFFGHSQLYLTPSSGPLGEVLLLSEGRKRLDCSRPSPVRTAVGRAAWELRFGGRLSLGLVHLFTRSCLTRRIKVPSLQCHQVTLLLTAAGATLQEISRALQVSLILAVGASWLSPIVPLQKPITVVVGRPVHVGKAIESPTQAQVPLSFSWPHETAASDTKPGCMSCIGTCPHEYSSQ